MLLSPVWALLVFGLDLVSLVTQLDMVFCTAWALQVFSSTLVGLVRYSCIFGQAWHSAVHLLAGDLFSSVLSLGAWQ